MMIYERLLGCFTTTSPVGAINPSISELYWPLYVQLREGLRDEFGRALTWELYAR